MAKISVVINTWNEEKNLPRALGSAYKLADEIIVVDMHSSDKTVEIAGRAGAKVYFHKPTGYVEPARNFALRQAQGEYIFVLDADEEIPPSLVVKLRQLVEKGQADFYRIPRKNIIFGKVLKHSRWWPDYNIRFFKKGSVEWSEVIHSVPITRGQGQDLAAQEKYAIVHHNYATVGQYIERMARYTDIQAKGLVKGGYKFSWQDLARKPLAEFLSRFFAGEGWRDGGHGLLLCLLQAFSELVVYAKVWELQKFGQVPLKRSEIGQVALGAGGEVEHWLVQSGMRRISLPKRVLRKLLS